MQINIEKILILGSSGGASAAKKSRISLKHSQKLGGGWGWLVGEKMEILVSIIVSVADIGYK